MRIEYDKNTNKFLITCKPEENELVVGLPDRRFRKGTGVWAVPVLSRNIEYMQSRINNPQMFSADALRVFNRERQALKAPVAAPGINAWPEWYTFKNQPLKHQEKGLKKFFPLDACGIFYEQGLGKTFTTINLACAWRMTNHIDSCVIFCPSSIKLVWAEELRKHSPLPVQVHSLTSGKYGAADKFIDNKTDFQWLIVGIEGLSQGKAAEYVEKFCLGRKVMMAVDESSRIKTPNKIRTDKTIKLGKLAKKRVVLSGTSITQGLEDLYTQFKFLNVNILGYDSFYSFRAHFCVTISVTVGYDDRGNEQTVQKIIGYKNEAEFMSLVKPYVERVEKADALDLPPKTFTNRYITMNPTQKRLYDEMKEDLMIEIGSSSHEVTTVLEQMLRLQQITGGHYPWDNGEKIVPIQIPGKNPKIDELMQLMQEVSGKIIVWCQFRCEILQVSEALEAAGIHYVEFHGGVKEDEKITAVDSFRNNPQCKVFLATRAAAFGLTLIEASTAVYYSQGYSLEDYAQSQDRIHRIGQDSHCNYIHLVCDRTIDVKIIKALKEKASVAQLMYDLMKYDDKINTFDQEMPDFIEHEKAEVEMGLTAQQQADKDLMEYYEQNGYC